MLAAFGVAKATAITVRVSQALCIVMALVALLQGWILLALLAGLDSPSTGRVLLAAGGGAGGLVQQGRC